MAFAATDYGAATIHRDLDVSAMATSPPPSGSPPSDQEDAALPALRQELRLFPGEPLITGAPTWLLFDPVRNAYHRLERAVYQRLSLWEDQPISRYLARVNARFDMSTDEDDVKELVTFLYAQKLVILPPGGDSESFAAQEFAASPPLSHTLIHKYLFFRIPLVRPDNFLKATYPFIRWIFTRAALYAVIGIGLLGLYFAGRQWDVFASTFLHFLTFEGLIYYGLTLAVLKIFHELGHAYTAHHFGSRVPVMGLAFLVMFPILYTDTTNAWELTDRRKRVLIDAGGILAELMIAALALFAWSFLPDGPMRSAAFFAATTSWVFSLMVNLNPLMRFDGYYLITDLWRVPNLQTAGLDMGRWHLRETLFGLNEPAPECDSKARRRGYIIYAYSVWVYRFFLFIGIALLVHALFPKAIGIILFSVEIGWFIVKPILNELKHWWSIRMKIIQTSRGRGALAVTLGALVFACLPWQSTITAPAILRPAQQSEIYPLEAARIERIYVHNGQNVRAGEPLAVLHSDALDNEHRLAELQLALIEAQLARRAADTQDRSASSVLLGARKRELATLAGLEKSR
ncbi:MAG: biotin/lipoyl-binding protein, partial [Robiginitomaculum sp.]